MPDPTLNLLVPALLKRWKRLQSGLELSAEAFLNLSKRFKEQTKTWLEEDQVAQRTRHNKPDAMDIYDTIKTQGMGHICICLRYNIYIYHKYIIFSSVSFCNTATVGVGGITSGYHPWSDFLDCMWY
jgi:hypothetical protein